MTKTKQEKKSKEQHTWMSWMTTKEKGPKLEAKQKKRRGENASPVFLESHPWKISDELLKEEVCQPYMTGET